MVKYVSKRPIFAAFGGDIKFEAGNYDRLQGELDLHGVAEQRFWRLVADCIIDYQQAHPELSDKFARYDLFAPEFARSCLNRLQLRNNQQMLNLADPAGSLQLVGTLANPIAAYRPVAAAEPAEA